MNYLLLGGFAFLAYRYVSGGKRLENLTGKPVKLKYVKQSGLLQNLLTTKLELDFLITNPNNRISRFQQLQLKVKYTNKVISTLDLRKNIDLAANDDTIIRGIKMNISNLTMANQILDVITNSGSSFGKLLVEGNFWADGFKYPYSEEINLTE